MQEDEKSLEQWAGGLKALDTMKTDISQYVLPTDMVLLQGHMEELHSQWEELCLKVSEREREKRGGSGGGGAEDCCAATQYTHRQGL